MKFTSTDTGYGFIRVLNISSSPLNKKMIKGLPTLSQRYKGVGKCLVAFACQYSIELGLDGYADLQSKTATKGLYLNLGADNPFGGDHITFDDQAAKALSVTYFKGGIKWL